MWRTLSSRAASVASSQPLVVLRSGKLTVVWEGVDEGESLSRGAEPLMDGEGESMLEGVGKLMVEVEGEVLQRGLGGLTSACSSRSTVEVSLLCDVVNGIKGSRALAVGEDGGLWAGAGSDKLGDAGRNVDGGVASVLVLPDEIVSASCRRLGSNGPSRIGTLAPLDVNLRQPRWEGSVSVITFWGPEELTLC